MVRANRGVLYDTQWLTLCHSCGTEESMSTEKHWPELGRRIRHARDDLRIRQGELAKAAGISRETLIRLEKGAATVSVLVIARIAHRLGVRLAELLPDEIPPLLKEPPAAA
jgi:DNA-binding XRE family transcriptional regulator